MKFSIRGNPEREWRKVERLWANLPAIVLRDVAADAAGVAVKEILPVLKKRDFSFTDRGGKLRRSIRTRQRRSFGKRIGKSQLSLAYLLAGGKRAPYGYLVHEGHGGSRPAGPRPYLRTALNQTSSEVFSKFVQVFISQMTPAVQQAARRLLIKPYRR